MGSKSITGPGIYVDENLTFDEVFSNISAKYLGARLMF